MARKSLILPFFEGLEHQERVDERALQVTLPL